MRKVFSRRQVLNTANKIWWLLTASQLGVQAQEPCEDNGQNSCPGFRLDCADFSMSNCYWPETLYGCPQYAYLLDTYFCAGVCIGADFQVWVICYGMEFPYNTSLCCR